MSLLVLGSIVVEPKAASPSHVSQCAPQRIAVIDLFNGKVLKPVVQGLNGVSMYVKREWDSLGEVMIHRPGIEMFYGLLHPKSFLYERAFSMDEALYEHEVLEHALEREGGVAVHRAKKVIVQRIKSSPRVQGEGGGEG